jgi:hypothetical protein
MTRLYEAMVYSGYRRDGSVNTARRKGLVLAEQSNDSVCTSQDYLIALALRGSTDNRARPMWSSQLRLTPRRDVATPPKAASLAPVSTFCLSLCKCPNREGPCMDVHDATILLPSAPHTGRSFSSFHYLCDHGLPGALAGV